ncbi:hypothetical protein DSO57_1029848 [Entomophthora muscae]|uniref:Uncharacterized protein n=1 Tax=Entomophthora muscae TaxID=34485 RepID=A0ACC2S3B7_9FUNG|nr:hypothetical protein DSO57_1029848 [Entomophthora muscae]
MEYSSSSVSSEAKKKGRPRKSVSVTGQPRKPVAIAPGNLQPYSEFSSGLMSTLYDPCYYTAPPQPGKRHYYVPEDVEVIFTQAGKPIQPIPALAPAAPPPRIPRAPNSFMLYRKHKCKEVAANNPSLDNNGVSHLLGKMWRNETPEVRASFVAMARETKRLHQIMYPHYRYSPRFPKTKSPKKPSAEPPSHSPPATTINTALDSDFAQFLTQSFFDEIANQQPATDLQATNPHTD